MHASDQIGISLSAVLHRIREAEARWGRPPGSVDLLAVSKTHPAERVRAAFAQGQTRFGESRVQEALPKIEALRDLPLEWHFIGPLQSNKTRPVAEHFAWVHSVDGWRLARRLSEQRPAALAPLSVCLEVNLSGEASKRGLPPARVEELALAVAALPGLRLRGLMTIPAPTGELALQRLPFRDLHRIWLALRGRGLDLDTLSMGMSADLEAAIAEGATLVRVGTAIFGERGAT
jgi:hypothetical protein